jgi:hypothetical protein
MPLHANLWYEQLAAITLRFALRKRRHDVARWWLWLCVHFAGTCTNKIREGRRCLGGVDGAAELSTGQGDIQALAREKTLSTLKPDASRPVIRVAVLIFSLALASASSPQASKMSCSVNAPRGDSLSCEQGLLEWAWRHGVSKQMPVRPALCQEAGCRGMVATRAIAEGETILSIPRSLFMSADSALECPLVLNLLDRARNAGQCLCERQILAVHLLVERHKACKSKWMTFISSIPSEYSTLEYWRDAEVQVSTLWQLWRATSRVRAHMSQPRIICL